jgi:transposase
MPALLHARPPTDPAEARRLRKLAAARHAPASWIQRARIITASWDGASVPDLAQRLGCHPKTVHKWLPRFNTNGIDGLADLPRPGLPRRLSEHDRGRIIALARTQPPRRLPQGGEGCRHPTSRRRRRPGRWTPWRRPPAPRGSGRPQPGPPDPARQGGAPAADAVVGDQHRPGLRPKRAAVIALSTAPPTGVTVRCAAELGPVIPRSSPPAPGWTADGHRVKAVLDYGRGPEQDLGGGGAAGS